VTAAIEEVGDAEHEREWELDQCDRADAGRERDGEKREEERGSGVFEQVASSAREVLRASPAVERGS
jgi:hypothetical protein